ncbi:MAG: hypothetical protein NWF07_02975 [Candidatus Bathyarchaeota archaeon]|nr:hypothetical protein [Candidatus Bathyarchaeota archaeon]
MRGAPILPDHPKVVLDGSAVVIHYENGEREIWGYEPNLKIANEIASDIEIGLKAINYVSLELMKELSELAEQLKTLGVPEEYINEYIYEGYCKLAKRFQELDAKPKIRKEIDI